MLAVSEFISGSLISACSSVSFVCAASEAGLSPGAVAGIIISIIALVVFGAAILLYIRQRQGLLTTLSTENSYFSNILYKFTSTSETEHTEARQEEVNLGEVTVVGGTANPGRGKVTLEGAATDGVEADA